MNKLSCRPTIVNSWPMATAECASILFLNHSFKLHAPMVFPDSSNTQIFASWITKTVALLDLRHLSAPSRDNSVPSPSSSATWLSWLLVSTSVVGVMELYYWVLNNSWHLLPICQPKSIFYMPVCEHASADASGHILSDLGILNFFGSFNIIYTVLQVTQLVLIRSQLVSR